MIRITLLIVIGALVVGGWTWARELEILDHPGTAHLQVMQDPGCDPSSNPSGGQ